MARLRTKAMMFTVGAVIIVAVMLLFTSVVIKTRRDNIKAQQVQYAFNRIANVHDSLEKSMQDVVLSSSGIGIAIDNTTVTFNEELPNAHVNSLRNRLDALEEFIGEDSIAILDVDALKDNATFRILPQNISYSHDDFGSDIRIDPTGADITRYHVNAVADDSVSCSWDYTPGFREVRVSVTGENSSCDDTRWVDLSATNTVAVNNGNMTITFSDSVLVESTMTANITITLELNSSALSVIHPYDAMTIVLPRFERRTGITIV